jgi:hypothetical protein
MGRERGFRTPHTDPETGRYAPPPEAVPEHDGVTQAGHADRLQPGRPAQDPDDVILVPSWTAVSGRTGSPVGESGEGREAAWRKDPEAAEMEEPQPVLGEKDGIACTKVRWSAAQAPEQ